MKSKKRKLLDLLILFSLLPGIGVLAYPFVSDELNNYLDQQIISHYQQQAIKENEEVMAKIQENMTKKNQQLAKESGSPGADPSTKKKEPAKKDRIYFEKHTIGILTVPKINVNLPIFDQTTVKLLEKGACLLEGTSYPIGDKLTHVAPLSHRGLSQAKLSTNLSQLKIKDHFYIEVSGQYLAYQVDQIKTIEPTETEALQIQEDRGLITLVTCTLYMINSHRLLVCEHRVVVEPEEIKESLEKVKQAKCTAFLLVSGLIGMLLLLFLVILIKFLKK